MCNFQFPAFDGEITSKNHEKTSQNPIAQFFYAQIASFFFITWLVFATGNSQQLTNSNQKPRLLVERGCRYYEYEAEKS